MGGNFRKSANSSSKAKSILSSSRTLLSLLSQWMSQMRRRIRTSPGLTTVNARESSLACSRITAATAVAFVSEDSPAKRTSITPSETRRCRKTNSPKSLSAVKSGATCLFAIAKTTSSEILGSISATESTVYPSLRRRSTIARSMLSSATRFIDEPVLADRLHPPGAHSLQMPRLLEWPHGSDGDALLSADQSLHRRLAPQESARP